MTFSLGEMLQAGKYRLDALIEERQWGMTFLATHLSVNQPVLIKTFQATDTVEGPSRAQVDSFLHYAKTLTRFHHPQLSRVSSTFEEGQRVCMVSEFIQGESLSQLIQAGPLPESKALQYMLQVLQGLHALHRHGLLHLNVRPSRILKRQGGDRVVLIGLNSRFSNHPEEVEGKPYLAPEQYQALDKVGVASELYGVAATLYTLVTGIPPLAAGDRLQTPLTPPRQLRPDLSVRLEQAILAGLALNPSDRPQSLKAWLKLLPQIPPVASPQTAQKTTLQVPSAWKVKLPAFRAAGVKNAVSAVINSEQPSSVPKTTLQAPTFELKPVADVPPSDQSGHSELDALLAEISADVPPPSTPLSPQTTLQIVAPPVQEPPVPEFPVQEPLVPEFPVQESPVQEPLVTESPVNESPVNESPAESSPQRSSTLAQPDVESVHTHSADVDSVETVEASSDLNPQTPAPDSSPSPVFAQAEPLIQPDVSDMTTAFNPKSSRFPKWTLFWCALVAACGGLGAGLWFRVQVAQQFQTPFTPVEPSPLEKLKSLDTKEEKFLPTESSVIPPDKSDENLGFDESSPEADLDIVSGDDFQPMDEPSAVDESLPEPFNAREPSPWNASDRARESGQTQTLEQPVDLGIPVAPEQVGTFTTDTDADPALSDYQDDLDPALEPLDLEAGFESNSPLETSPSDNFTYNTSSDSSSNRF